MPDNSEKQERARTPAEQRLLLERAEEIAVLSREAELRQPRLRIINSDGEAVESKDWEGRHRPKMAGNDCGVSLLGAVRRLIAKGRDGDRLVAMLKYKLSFHVRDKWAEAREAYDNARSTFKQWGAQGLIDGEGIHPGAHSPSSITQGEWQSWEIDGWRNRLIDPADRARTITGVWIKNMAALLNLQGPVANVTKRAVNKHDGNESKAKAKKDCQAWLVNRMTISPECRPKQKGKHFEEAQTLFKGLSERSFIEAWAAAVEETGAEAWSAGGAPKKARTK